MEQIAGCIEKYLDILKDINNQNITILIDMVSHYKNSKRVGEAIGGIYQFIMDLKIQ
jgi:hypothetical protein